MIEDDPRNGVSRDQAAAWCEELFGLSGRLTRLDGDQDASFRLETDDSRYLLKIAAPGTDSELPRFQNALLNHLHDLDLGAAIPSPVAALNGYFVAGAADSEGGRRYLRVQSYVEGRPLAEIRPHTEGLMRQIGDLLGRLDKALTGFTHPSAHRPLGWDLPQYAWINEKVDLIDGPGRDLLNAVIESVQAEVEPHWGRLRTSVIHNDANDYNLLVTDSGTADPRLTGLIDFGDAVETITVAEPAIACTYLMMNKRDPLSAGADIVGAYHHRFPLTDQELHLLPYLIRLRLAISVVTSTLRKRERPDDCYGQVSAAGAWRLLEELDGIPAGLVEAVFRAACSLTPCPSGPAVTGWITGNVSEPAELLPAMASSRKQVLDLSVESSDLPGTIAEDTVRFERWVKRALEDAGALVGVGRYDEARLLYTGEQFEAAGRQRRTVHLGIDLFAPEATPVFAPLDGRLHSWADNDAPADYGPTLILEHGDESIRFYTLYGHLSAESLQGLREGDAVSAGQQIGNLGNLDENGGWPPHLHFQLICDLLGERGTFPGVAAPRLRDVWLSICPDPTALAGLSSDSVAPRCRSTDALSAMRRAHVSPSLSLSYSTPLHIVRGRGQYLFDPEGRRYIDGVNNVAHVGHCHPKVVEAEQRQAARLNTNTRYLHRNPLDYAERLTSLLPEPLSVCFFVCSGSEANELALRLARAHTGSDQILVLEGSYHGNTSDLVEVSSYKFDGPSGRGPAQHVHPLPMPDPFRGRFRGAASETTASYVATVEEAVAEIRSKGGRPAAFLYEPLMGCGGQIVPPPGYYLRAQEIVHRAGGVNIADEVQVGFGRVGSPFWAFALHDVVPDIVTMGKPIGNGYPLAAVVTTAEIAQSFDNGMEYFNTFGGNPVASAVGQAVLDVIEGEGLSEHAGQLGSWILERFDDLATRHALIGEVRGAGLFLGVELVSDREKRTPAAEEAAYVVEQMKERGVLLSTDGPDHNVIKFKPPLVFERTDAEWLIEALDEVLLHDFCRRGAQQRR